MKTTNDITSHADFARVEAWLIAAGFAYTVVDKCPEPRCEVCRLAPVSAAA